jgi:putative ABC transport system permease protein
MNYPVFAWKNLWRNRRRTLITIASVFFGVVLATLMYSLMDGIYGNMIDIMVKLSSGYMQVQDPGYRENSSINDIFYPEDTMVDRIEGIDGITTVAKRLDAFALLSSGPNTRGGAVIGFEPAMDRETSSLERWVSHGRFIRGGDTGVLVTANVAGQLNIGVNDSIILIGQGFMGITAAGIYPVSGILTFNTPQMNDIGVFMDISSAQDLFRTEGMVTSLMIMVEDYTDVDRVKGELEGFIDDQVVADWKELNPGLVNFIEGDRAAGSLMIWILYMIIGFGILGTIIMMVAERRRELAVMAAVGMRKYRLAIILFLETVFIGLTGVISGFAVSVPVIYVLVRNPVRLPENMAEVYLDYGIEPYLIFGDSPSVFISQVVTIFIITMIVSVYPILKVKNLVVSKSLKS